MSATGRNERCPCGSGSKYKRCCLRKTDEVALDVARLERVWERMQGWAMRQFGDELCESLKEHMDARAIGTEEHRHACGFWAPCRRTRNQG
ncbi:MAG: SEC-C metal-binding domain-containing protein [Sciscionella sp.]